VGTASLLQAIGALAVSIEFLVTSFIVIVSPGTGVLYTLAAGLSRGSRASVVAAFGCIDESNPLSRMLALSAVFMLITFVIFVGYGLFAASIRDHVISRPRVLTWMRRAFAGAFAALGAKLAFADR
jgi:threonine/homoserine/homoserine lactone efflux protein